jgi:hypothetical protein
MTSTWREILTSALAGEVFHPRWSPPFYEAFSFD